MGKAVDPILLRGPLDPGALSCMVVSAGATARKIRKGDNASRDDLRAGRTALWRRPGHTVARQPRFDKWSASPSGCVFSGGGFDHLPHLCRRRGCLAVAL